MARGRSAALRFLVLATAGLATASGALAQEATPPQVVDLSLEQAVRRAVGESEEARLARARIDVAEAQVTATRASALPQINGSFGYTRTFASAFESGGFELPDSLRFDPDPTGSLKERIRYLEENAPLAGLGGLGELFGDLPFGQENAYVAAISGSQLLYSGGQVGAALQIARNFRAAAGFQLREELAEIELQVRTAYVQALLAEEMMAISAAALEQAEDFLARERLRLRAGQASELEVMRAEVQRDNLRPPLVQARNAAELALLNLKRLTDVPMDAELRLTTTLEPPAPAELAETEPRDEVVLAQRAALLAANEQVQIREQQVRIARGAFLPNVSLQMNYGRQLFPSDVFRLDEPWRTDWTAGLQVQIPLFQGFRRTAEMDQAHAELLRARLQYSQLREAVQLQYRQAQGEKERARSEIEARGGTVAVAERVYDLTVLRYDRGLATQLEVSDARLGLLQARTNLAQSVADFYIADAGLTRSRAQVDAEAGALPSRPEIPDVRQPAADVPKPPAPPVDNGARTLPGDGS